jgi:methylase of polypeptide subunit release factors
MLCFSVMKGFEKPLSSEWEGTPEPRGSELEAIQESLAVAALHRRARMLKGVEIPSLKHYLERQPYDPAPARTLLARHEALTYPFICDFGDVDLEIDEGVFCPTLTSASPFLLRHVDFRRGERVLDAFAGSGAFGVWAALQRGDDVVSFDSSWRAVTCARKNALRNNVESTMEVRYGTLKQVIRGNEVFDLIIANPPLVPGESVDLLGAALFDPGMKATIEFVQALPALLARKGRCYLLTSDIIDRHAYKLDIVALCRQNDLKMSTIAQLNKEYESYRVHKICRRLLPASLFF